MSLETSVGKADASFQFWMPRVTEEVAPGTADLGVVGNFFSGADQGRAYLLGVKERVYRKRVEIPATLAYGKIASSLSAIIRQRSVVGIVDMGPGDGERSILLLKSLRRSDLALPYFAVDCNSWLLAYSVRRLRVFSEGNVTALCCDFSDLQRSSALKRLPAGPRLFTFGSTALNLSVSCLINLGNQILRRGDLILLTSLTPANGDRVGNRDVGAYVAPEHEQLSRLSISPEEQAHAWQFRPIARDGYVDVGFDLTRKASGRKTVLKSYRFAEGRLVKLLSPNCKILAAEKSGCAAALLLEWRN